MRDAGSWLFELFEYLHSMTAPGAFAFSVFWLCLCWMVVSIYREHKRA